MNTKIVKLSLVICLSLFMTMSCAKKSPANSLETYMDAQAEINNFSGTVLVTKNNSILLKKAYGYADMEWNVKNTIDTKFSLASVSKQFTAVATLQLAECNKLSLDDKLSKYYPRFRYGDSISLKMLLTHNSGIGDDVDELFSSNTSFKKDSVVNYIMTKHLLFEPGLVTSYSNTGYYLLATIIEKVSGQTYANYLKEHVFKRTNMLNSGVSSNDSIISKMAKPYYYKNGKLIKNPFSNWNYNIGLDGVYSTIEDLNLWNKHLFDKTTLLSEEMKSQMFTAYNEEDFGYGVLVNPFYNQSHYLIGHDGGYYGTQTSLHKYPDDEVFIVLLSNNESPSYLLAYSLAAIVFGKDVELPYYHKKQPIDANILRDYVGDYEGVIINENGGKLYYRGIELIPESNTKFFRADNDDITFEFVKNEQGETIEVIFSKMGVNEIKKKN